MTQEVEKKLLALLNFDGVSATQLSNVGNVVQWRHCSREATVGRHQAWVQRDQLHKSTPSMSVKYEHGSVDTNSAVEKLRRRTIMDATAGLTQTAMCFYFDDTNHSHTR